MTRSNKFRIDSTSLGPLLRLNPIIFIWIMKRIEFHSLFRIPFIYLYSDILPFTFHMENGEKRSQSCSHENIGLPQTSH